MANEITDKDRGVSNRRLTGSIPAKTADRGVETRGTPSSELTRTLSRWGPGVFRFEKPDGKSYELEFKGGASPARWTAKNWADYFGHKLLSENSRLTDERPPSPRPIVQAQTAEPEFSPPPLVEADPIFYPNEWLPWPKPKHSKAKSKQTEVKFDDGSEITGRRLPETTLAPKTWQEKKEARYFKDTLLLLSNLPYSTFELRGPEPPSRVARDAVAYWLGLHKAEIVQAEKDWKVSRLAIAGIIAYEALMNPQIASYKSVGPGKMHLEGDDGQLSWPDVIEGTHRMKPLNSLLHRKIEMAKPDVAINYIGAALDIIATITEDYGRNRRNIRNNLQILGQVYHSRTPKKWLNDIETKPANTPFIIRVGMMGQWIEDNRKYLETAVGHPEYQ